MATVAGTLARPANTGVWSWITTVDHKRIGVLYGITAFSFFMWGGVQALLIRTQLAVPNGTVIDAERFNQLFTMHALTMIFLAVMPLGAAFFNFLTPLMIGARDVAFPRLNALSYWVFLGGGLLLTSRASSSRRPPPAGSTTRRSPTSPTPPTSASTSTSSAC